MLIRKRDFKMYKYYTRSKNVEKVFAHCPNDYLDPLDREMLILRHLQINATSTPTPKWLNKCWDSFRHVDNHNKSHIFQPKLLLAKAQTGVFEQNKESPGQATPCVNQVVEAEDKYINIESVREKLKAN